MAGGVHPVTNDWVKSARCTRSYQIFFSQEAVHLGRRAYAGMQAHPLAGWACPFVFVKRKQGHLITEKRATWAILLAL